MLTVAEPQNGPGATLDDGIRPAVSLEPLPDERPQRRREYSGAGPTLGVAALIILVVGAAVWFFEVRGSGSDAGGGGSDAGIVDLPAGITPVGGAPAAREGRTAPNFRLSSPDGSALTLSDLRGRFVLVNFWASWCGPCRGEAPDLDALARRQPPARFTVIGVNQQESAETARAFANEFDISYPVVLDRSGAVSQAYRVSSGLPVSFLVSPQGVILKIFIGRVGAEDLKQLEKDYLG